jgi:hypothetical protein
MAGARQLGDDEVLRLRLAAQALHRPAGLSTAQLIRHLTGVQAQVLKSAALALGARSRSLTARMVDSARLEDRSIVLCWAMRGTFHLVAAEDHGWIVPLTVEPERANALRRLKQEGVPPRQPERALHLIEQLLEREGPLTRPEIGERLQREGIHTEGQSLAHLLWLAAATARVCSGPDRQGKQCFVLTRDWLGQSAPIGPEAAPAELALRYLAAHGPAEPVDLAFWSGLRLADAKAAWSSIRDKLTEVHTAGGPLWMLRSRARHAEPGLVRLLPAFDEYLMGWKDRRLIARAEDWALVNRGGGWVHPVLLFDGRLVGTWRSQAKPSVVTIEVSPFTDLPPAARHGAEAEVSHVAGFLGTSARLAVDYSKTITERSSSPFAMTAKASSTSSRRIRRDTMSSR